MKQHRDRRPIIYLAIALLLIGGSVSIGFAIYHHNHRAKQQILDNSTTREGVTIVLLSSDGVWDVGARWKTVLKAKGMKVIKVVNSSGWQSSTTIIDNSHGKKPATFAELESLFGKVRVENTTLSLSYPDAQFILVLGRDQKNPAM